MRIRFLALGLVVAAFGSGCNFFFPFAPDQLGETLIRAQCHFAFACCNFAERTSVGGLAELAGFRNEGECVNERLEEGPLILDTQLVQEAVAQGRFEFDGALAESWVKPLIDAHNNCDADAVLGDALGGAGAECDPLFERGSYAFGKGLVKAGDRCFADFECADFVRGGVCEPQEDPNEDTALVTAVGLCKAPAAEGEDCSEDGSDGLCETGTFCDPGTQECTEVPPLLQQGEDCFVDFECDAGLFCDDRDGTVQSTCALLLDDGEDCLDDGDCLGDRCADDGNGNDICKTQAFQVEACNGLQGDDTEF